MQPGGEPGGAETSNPEQVSARISARSMNVVLACVLEEPATRPREQDRTQTGYPAQA
jgi:hypothetical protein